MGTGGHLGQLRTVLGATVTHQVERLPEEENTWEPVTHLGDSMELVEEFHQVNLEKPN
jgi:hypothetical protein